MTICGLLFGLKPNELVEQLTERGVTGVNIEVYYSANGLSGPLFSVKVEEVKRENGKLAYFSDRVISLGFKYDGFKFYSADCRTFHHPKARNLAIDVARLLDQKGIGVTVEGASVDAT